MRIFRTLFCGFFVLFTQYGFAQDSDTAGEPDNLLRLKTDSFNYSKESILELWVYQNGYGDSTLSDIYRLRFYQPLSINQWKGMMRIDTAYNSTWGPEAPGQSSGQFSAGNTMLTVWGMPPDFFSKWNLNLGGRIIFPFVNNGKWAVGQQVSASFVRQLDLIYL